MRSLVLVVGAGASREVGMPLGAELVGKIAELMPYDAKGATRGALSDVVHAAITDLWRTPAATENDAQEFMRACQHIQRAVKQAQSIDNFIDSHRGDAYIEQCAKLGIALAILQAEKESRMHFNWMKANESLPLAKVSGTWFAPFAKMLYEQCAFSDLAARLERITIVCFNYDRCIELYLHEVLCNYYQRSSGEVLEVLESLTIIHPYGTVGTLPKVRGGEGLPFGEVPTRGQPLIAAMQGLKTFTEGVKNEQMTQRIRSAVLSAETLVFLGFAFHPLNMELLFGAPSTQGVSMGRVIGTAYEVSKEDVEDISQEIAFASRLDDKQVRLRDLKCVALFTTFTRALSMTGRTR